MAKTAILPLLSSLFLLISPILTKANPLFYPPANNPQTFMVLGKGKAHQKADTAVLQLLLGSAASTENNPVALSLSNLKKTPIEIQIQDIIDALIAIGIKSTEIQVQYPQSSSGGLTIPFPFPPQTNNGETKILVTVPKPTHPRLQQIITTAASAVSKEQPFILGSVGVRYSVSDCQELQRETYQNAIKDAQNRASAIAEAVDAVLNPIPSVAEPFYNVFMSEECATGEGFLFSSSTVPYDANTLIEVQVSKDIFVTFSVR